MILAVHTSNRNSSGLVRDLFSVLRAHAARRRGGEEPSAEDAVVRALCHDMGASLACLERALGQLDGDTSRADLLSLARAQAADLTSMLRTAGATAGDVRRTSHARLLRDVVGEAVAACGLTADLLTVRFERTAGDVTVADARVKRILLNLLENAHRHGDGAAVRLLVTRRDGQVAIALAQQGLAAHRVVGHLTTRRPPSDLTGLGLWSVQRQAGELGGSVAWSDEDGWLTLTVLLPDR